MKAKNSKRLLSVLLVLCLVLAMASAVTAAAPLQKDRPVIGISWKSDSQNYAYYKHIIRAAGGIPVELGKVTSQAVSYDGDGKVLARFLEPSGMLKQPYADAIKIGDFARSNIADVLQGVDGVFFTGGEDISPSLFKTPQKEDNEGEEINAARDISDYILMDYCIKNDIPSFAACRGEQMMGIVSGVTFIQDIPNYYKAQGKEYDDAHRMPVGTPHRTYARHDVDILPVKSHLSAIVSASTLQKVSSWHHQAILSLEGTDLIQTAKTTVNGIDIVEGIENPNKTFCVGVQFHPENDCSLGMYSAQKEQALCDLDTCFRFFQELVKYAAEKKAA